jgi:hypothetical protein
MDNFVQEKINEIKVVRLTTPCIQNYKK